MQTSDFCVKEISGTWFRNVSRWCSVLENTPIIPWMMGVKITECVLRECILSVCHLLIYMPDLLFLGWYVSYCKQRQKKSCCEPALLCSHFHGSQFDAVLDGSVENSSAKPGANRCRRIYLAVVKGLPVVTDGGKGNKYGNLIYDFYRIIFKMSPCPVLKNNLRG